MKDADLIQALKRIKVQTGGLICLGCGHEHNCGVHGCAVIREAVLRLEGAGFGSMLQDAMQGERLDRPTGQYTAYRREKEHIDPKPSADVAPVVHETPMLRYRPERCERYEEYGLNENGEMLYLKRVLVDEKSYAMYCPACGKRLCSRFTSFCPNCGAKMDGEE